MMDEVNGTDMKLRINVSANAYFSCVTLLLFPDAGATTLLPLSVETTPIKPFTMTDSTIAPTKSFTESPSGSSGIETLSRR